RPSARSRSGSQGRLQRGRAGAPEVRDRLAQAFLQAHLGPPAVATPYAADVRPPPRWVVHGPGGEVDTWAAGRRDHGVRQLQHGHFLRVTQVEHFAVRVAVESDLEEAAHEVADVAEGAGLAAVAVDGQALPAQGRADEGRDRPSVVRGHAGAVGVEDAHDAAVD